MLSATEIKNVKFARAMSGYKQEEVDILLDKVEADYVQFDRVIKELKARIDSLEKENSDFKDSQNSIQSVLLSAQRLADAIINEAKEKSEEIIKNAEVNIETITAHEKELSATFEIKAQERKNELEKELNSMVNDAKTKADSITAAAEDSVKRQQMLFEKLKLEISAFKSAIQAKYKEHLEILSVIPDTVPFDPVHMAELVALEIDKAPAPQEFIKREEAEEIVLPETLEINEKLVTDNGFSVEQIDLISEE